MGKVEETLARNVLQRRKALGLSQEALAQKARVSYHTVWRVENAQGIPRKSNLGALATALNCTVDQLLATSAPHDETIRKILQMLPSASDGDLKDVLDLLESRLSRAASKAQRKA